MYANKIIKLINGTTRPLKYISEKCNPPFITPKKALVALPGYIGDVILIIPMLRNLRYNLGAEVEIDIVCNKNIYNLVETLPYIDNFYPVEKIGKNKVLFLQNNEYDTVFLFNIPILWAFASYKAGIKQRVSLTLERLGLDYPIIWKNLVTHLVKSTPITDKKPQWKVYLDTLQDLNLNIFDEHLEIHLTDDDINKAKNIMQEIKRPRIAVHITAGSPGKEWNLDNWIMLIKYLNDKYDCSFISTGVKNEKPIYDYLSSQTGVKINNLCGKTTLRETVALYRYFDLIVTLDTAAAHFAAVANTKNIVVIYGPTNHAQWAPYAPSSNIHQVYKDLPCRPCLTRFCRHKECLNKLYPEQVISVIDQISV